MNLEAEIKGWMQKTAEKKADEVIEFTDLVRDEMGADTSTQFADTMNGAYDALYSALEQAHGQIVIGQDIIMGKNPSAGEPMGAEEPVMDEPAPEGPGDEDAGVELDDEFGATAPAAGGDEPADRTRRESIERSRRLGAIMSEGNLSDYVNDMKTAQQRKAVRGGKGRAVAAGKVDPRATKTPTLGDFVNQRVAQNKKDAAKQKATKTPTLGDFVNPRVAQNKKDLTNPANFNKKDGMK